MTGFIHTHLFNLSLQRIERMWGLAEFERELIRARTVSAGQELHHFYQWNCHQ